MARARQNTLRKSRTEMDRQQRQQQPDMPGASGTPADDSPQGAEMKARKRHGKTEKHVSEDRRAGLS
jgi:hypothetical protein